MTEPLSTPHIILSQAEEPLTLSHHHREALSPYLPPPRSVFLSEPSPSISLNSHSNPLTITPDPSQITQIPWVTLTYASSLDSRISLAPGVRTALSGSESKAMTHYLRTCHDAISIGVGTAEADDPGLRSRFVGEEEGRGGVEKANGGDEEGLKWQPRPFILDPSGRWRMETCRKLFENAGAGGREKTGRAPWWVVSESVDIASESRISKLKEVGGRILQVGNYDDREEGIEWEKLLRAMWATGVRSVMIEGGARVINDLLKEKHQWLVSSVIVTIAPVYLGEDGVEVAPVLDRRPLRLKDVKWVVMGEDVVIGGKIING